jgi:hypothetical protein
MEERPVTVTLENGAGQITQGRWKRRKQGNRRKRKTMKPILTITLFTLRKRLEAALRMICCAKLI